MNVEHLADVAKGRLINLKELYRILYRTEYLDKDTSDVLAEIEAEKERLMTEVMLWGVASEVAYLDSIGQNDE